MQNSISIQHYETLHLLKTSLLSLGKLSNVTLLPHVLLHFFFLSLCPHLFWQPDTFLQETGTKSNVNESVQQNMIPLINFALILVPVGSIHLNKVQDKSNFKKRKCPGGRSGWMDYEFLTQSYVQQKDKMNHNEDFTLSISFTSADFHWNTKYMTMGLLGALWQSLSSRYAVCLLSEMPQNSISICKLNTV